MGWIAQFLSKAVVTGFLAGAAIDVVIGELPKLTGTSADGDSAWRELGSWVRGLGDVHWATVLVGGAALAAILGVRGSWAGGPRRPRAAGRRPARLGRVRPRGRTGSRSSATSRAACRRRSSPTWT